MTSSASWRRSFSSRSKSARCLPSNGNCHEKPHHTRNEQDYISLTDMVRGFDGGSALIEQWLKNKDTVLFLGVWEQLNNPAFNSLEFEGN
nr:KilA-N domain-containing protein [Acidithiobacillus concretivorus]